MEENGNWAGTDGSPHEGDLRAASLACDVPGDRDGVRDLDREGGTDPGVCGNRPPKKPARGLFRRAYRIAEVRLYADGIVQVENADHELLADYCGALPDVAFAVIVDAPMSAVFWIERRGHGRPLLEVEGQNQSGFWPMTRGQFWARTFSRWAQCHIRERRKRGAA